LQQQSWQRGGGDSSGGFGGSRVAVVAFAVAAVVAVLEVAFAMALTAKWARAVAMT